MKDEYTEADWEMDCWNELTEEQKDELGRKAKALFNSDKSPLAFMIQSSGSISFVSKEKSWWKFWK